MNRLIYLFLLTNLLMGCFEQTNSKNKDLDSARRNSKALKKANSNCNTKEFYLPSGEKFLGNKCTDSIGKQKNCSIIYTSGSINDTLNVSYFYLKRMSNSNDEIMLMEIEKKGHLFEGKYFYESCAGDLCREMLIIQFEISDEGKIIFLDIYDFDFKTNKRQ